MASSKEDIKKAIKKYVSDNWHLIWDWYIGIAEDPEYTLFTRHNVSRDSGKWVYEEANSSTMAREAEAELISELRVRGGSGGGSDKTIFVYAYRISWWTKS